MAKKFVKVTGLSKVFATKTFASTNDGYDSSAIKSGVTAADSNSIMFIKAAATDNGKKIQVGSQVYTIAATSTIGDQFIWAQGMLFCGQDYDHNNIWDGTVKSVTAQNGVKNTGTSADVVVEADITNTTKNSAAATKDTSTKGGLYAVELDKDGHLAVRVPWENTHDSNAAGTGISVSGTRNNTIAISSDYQTKISNGDTAKTTLDTKASVWDAKQDALSFDGTYDASTNKVATVSTVNNAVTGLAGAMHFIGVAQTSAPTAGNYVQTVIGTTTYYIPKTTTGTKTQVIAAKGDVFIVSGGTKEYICTAPGLTGINVFTELGDEGAWDAKGAAATVQTNLETHTGNTTVHITAAERTAWNGKQAALTTAQLAAANSGITATKVSAYDAYATAIAGKQAAFTDGSATIASASGNVVTLKAGVAQSGGAISNSTGTDITLAAVAKTGAYSDLTGTPTIPAAAKSGALTLSAFKNDGSTAGTTVQVITGTGFNANSASAVTYSVKYTGSADGDDWDTSLA